MSVIALSGAINNYSIGINSYGGFGASFLSAVKSSGGLYDALSSLKSKIDVSCVATSADSSPENIVNAQNRESIKNSSLTLAYEKIDTFIIDAGETDKKVSNEISVREENFYEEYEYLTPECKKEESFGDWCESKWNAICNYGNSLKESVIKIAKNTGEWCKEHWKEIAKVLTVVVLVVVSVLLLVFVPGGGIISAILLGAAKGCLFGLASSTIINGVINKIKGKSFGDGALDAMFSGALGGFIGGAITGGLIGNAASMTKAASKGLLKLGSSTSLRTSIIRGAFVGSTSASVSNAGASALRYWIDNGTLDGSSKEVMISVFSGMLSGGIIGGIGGGFQYRIQNPTPINSKAYEFELKALMQQGISEQEAIKLINDFQHGINPDGKFAFHFTTLKGGEGITESGMIKMTELGFRGEGVYAGTSPLPTWEVKHIPYLGWGIGNAPVRIPIVLEGYSTKQVNFPLYSTVIESEVHFTPK